jgi:hypothetical protein
MSKIQPIATLRDQNGSVVGQAFSPNWSNKLRKIIRKQYKDHRVFFISMDEAVKIQHQLMYDKLDKRNKHYTFYEQI